MLNGRTWVGKLMKRHAACPITKDADAIETKQSKDDDDTDLRL